MTVQDWTTPTPNAAKHTNIAARATNFKGKEILCEWEHGVRDTSTCSNSVRVSSHHSGVYEHQRVDLLGATFDIPASDLDASDRFKGKATTKLRQSRDEGQWNLVGCESATYTCNHAAQLSITEGRAHLHHFFVEMRRLRRKLGTQTTHLTRMHGGNRMVDCRNTQGTTRPVGTSTVLPRAGSPTQGGPRNGRLGQHRLRGGVPAAGRNRAFLLRQVDAARTGATHKREGGIGIVLGFGAFRKRHPGVLRKHAIHTRVRKRTDRQYSRDLSRPQKQRKIVATNQARTEAGRSSAIQWLDLQPGVHLHERQRPVRPALPRRRRTLPTKRLQTRPYDHDSCRARRHSPRHVIPFRGR